MGRDALPILLTLEQAAEALGGNIPASTLRAEVRAGRLQCVRARPGCNAPILLTVDAILAWLNDHASKRQLSLSPQQARSAREQLEGIHGSANRKERRAIPRRPKRQGERNRA